MTSPNHTSKEEVEKATSQVLRDLPLKKQDYVIIPEERWTQQDCADFNATHNTADSLEMLRAQKDSGFFGRFEKPGIYKLFRKKTKDQVALASGRRK